MTKYTCELNISTIQFDGKNRNAVLRFLERERGGNFSWWETIKSDGPELERLVLKIEGPWTSASFRDTATILINDVIVVTDQHPRFYRKKQDADATRIAFVVRGEEADAFFANPKLKQYSAPTTVSPEPIKWSPNTIRLTESFEPTTSWNLHVSNPPLMDAKELAERVRKEIQMTRDSRDDESENDEKTREPVYGPIKARKLRIVTTLGETVELTADEGTFIDDAEYDELSNCLIFTQLGIDDREDGAVILLVINRDIFAYADTIEAE